MFPRSRNRTKAQVVGIGKEGGNLTWVVPKPKKFISITWSVLWEFLGKVFIATFIYVLGVLTGWLTN